MSILPLLVGVSFAAPLDSAFDAAAQDHQVPVELLKALAFEASHFDADAASAWGGYGLYDFREDGETFGPGIEQVAILVERSPDDIIASPELQIQGAAALLAWHAQAQLGELPETEDLEAWAPAIVAFSGRQEPNLQAMYVSYIYELLAEGIYTDTARMLPQEHVHPFDALNQLDLVLAPPPATPDYAGAATFTPAHSSNYSNYSRGASDINYVIIHTVQGSYSGCISWFGNSAANVSAHYVVRSSDGEVTQMLLEEDVGWHAGNWTYNEQSVGIEHEGYVDDPGKWYTSAMYESSAALTADIARRNSIPLDRSHIIAHYEVPSATHTDPGSGWDWSLYMDLVGGDSGTANAQMLGVVADGDIHSGERLVGAKVTLDVTGETVTVDSDGYYRFEGLPPGTYTATAKLSGYQSASCTKEVETGSGQWWCSIAMEPGNEPVDTGEPQDSGQDDTGTDADDTGVLPVPPGGPGTLESMPLGCSTQGGRGGLAGALMGLGGLALLLRRRRR